MGLKPQKPYPHLVIPLLSSVCFLSRSFHGRFSVYHFGCLYRYPMACNNNVQEEITANVKLMWNEVAPTPPTKQKKITTFSMCLNSLYGHWTGYLSVWTAASTHLSVTLDIDLMLQRSRGLALSHILIPS